jgi:AraC-like DNA-binding protein
MPVRIIAVRAARETIRLVEGHSFRVLRWESSLREVECLVAPGVFYPITGEGTHWHHHPEMELTLFTAGAGTRFVGDHIGSFRGGDLVLLGENLPHYWHTQKSSSGISVQWLFPKGHAFWTFPETTPLAALFQRAGRGLHLSGVLARSVAGQMAGLLRSSGACQLGGLFNLLGAIAEAGAEEVRPLSARSFALSAEGSHQKAIGAAVRYLVAHFREEVRLGDVLELAAMSRPTFARQFKQHSGRTFSEFVNGLRLQAACLELSQGERSILEIALGCGFSQISFFNRLFRRVMHCSPTEYRARLQAARTPRSGKGAS